MIIFRVLSTLRAAKAELLRYGMRDLFVIEEASGEILIGGSFLSPPDEKKLKHSSIQNICAEVDWEQQWKAFAKDFREGNAHINLADFGSKGTLRLFPGSGFGDLSHPTTYLMLDLMQNWIQGNDVIDIGCGSGILTIAAKLIGAKSALGIDIDLLALEHAKKNALLNQVEATFMESVPTIFPSRSIFLMNMILPEQKIVMQEQKKFHSADLWIVSGILASQRNEYIDVAKKWNWNLELEKKREDWLGMIFTPQPQS